MMQLAIILSLLFVHTTAWLRPPIAQRARYVAAAGTVTEGDLDNLGLTPELQQMTKALRAVSDDKLRYQQLMFLSKKLGPMEQVFQVDGNKVPGCQSIVYIHATADPETKKVSFLGASDAILTKGLVAMLVNGLSDCTAEEIEAVNPEFIMYAGVGATLTPGRNNGFLNMLATMKKKAWEAVGGPASAPPRAQVAPAQAPVGEGPVMASMRAKLSQLQPSLLHVKDDSAQHAGHAGTQGLAAAETHFSVQIRAACFEGLTLVQRHKMVYALLTEEIRGGVHALSIDAKTPSE